MGFFKTMLAGFLGALLAGIVFFFLLLMVVPALFTPKKSTLPKDAVLKIELKGEIKDKGAGFAVEYGEEAPTFSNSMNLGLFELQDILRKAKTDHRIKGIYFRPGIITAGWSTLKNLRQSLMEFRSSGKFIYAWADMYTEQSYYLASVANKVYLPASGMMELNGLSSQPYFLKGLLDKLGVEPKIFRTGTFKSAVEPFFNTEMSEASRLQTQELLADLWEKFAGDVCASRKMDRTAFEQLVSEYLVWGNPSFALESKLLDGIAYEDEVLNLMKTSPEGGGNGELEMVELKKYAEGVKGFNRAKRKPKVAIVFAEGMIVDGKGMNGMVGGDSYCKLFRTLREDSTVRAVVLRVNSPGGSALASDLMWHEIQELAKIKPVIASMGDVAASGGYYISAACNRIFADSNSITGSIGVFAVLPNVTKMTSDKLGITFDRVATHPYADMGSPVRPMLPIEEEKIQKNVSSMYERFLNVVKEGRKFPDRMAVDSIAQGRVWSGMDAHEKGLVDELGGLNKALDYAVVSAHLTGERGVDYGISVYPRDNDPFRMFLESFEENASIDLAALSPELQKELAFFKEVKQRVSLNGLYALMPYTFDIR